MRLLSFAALASTVLALLPNTVVASDSGNVVVLNSANFAPITQSNVTLVKFYAPWCGHCKNLAPEYEKAAVLLKDLVTLAEVDCTIEEDICRDVGVKGYPTLKIYRRRDSDSAPGDENVEVKDYAGPRQVDGIVSYMRKELLPIVSELEEADVDSFAKSDKVVAIGHFASRDSSEFKAYSAVAGMLRDVVVFGAVIDPSLTTPKLYITKTFDEGKDVYEGTEFTEQAIGSFVEISSMPIMDELSPENYQRYIESGVPIAYFFYSNPEEYDIGTKVVREVAKQHRGAINFVYLDANKFGGHAQVVNLKSGKWPAFAIHVPEHNRKYPYELESFKLEDIKAFVDDYVAGKIEPSLKSEPIPESNAGPVKVVVGKTYTEIVNDSTKDVFLEIYAPWCGHCKNLAPVWETLAADLSSNPNIVIAKLDGTANDLPEGVGYEIMGFPTLKLIKAGSNTVVDYDGDRSLEDLKSFLRTQASADDQSRDDL